VAQYYFIHRDDTASSDIIDRTFRDIIIHILTMKSPSATVSAESNMSDDASYYVDADCYALSPSSSLLVTPPASPSTLERRKNGSSCLEPPILKRKRDEDLTLPAQHLVSDLDIRYLDHQSRNKRRMISSRRNRLLMNQIPQGPLPFLNVADFTGAPTLPQVDAHYAPVITLRPRTNSYEEHASIEGHYHEETRQEQDENAPPPLGAQDTKTGDIISAALAVATSNDYSTNDLSAVSSSPFPCKSLKGPLQRSCSMGSAGKTAVGASAPISTPLRPAATAAPSSCSSNSSILTLSLSKRRLSFGSSSHHNRRGSSSSYQTPNCSTRNLVQSLEGLCLPSLENADSLANNNDASCRPAATRTLQQKRPPSTPHQGNANRSVTAATFDYLATALRLPDIAFTGGNI
jgi:hypothetical protein